MRYLPLNEADRAEMRRTIGIEAIDDLFTDVPTDALNPTMDLPDHASELEVERTMMAMARKNNAAGDTAFFVGCGAYRHHVPATVDHIIQRSEF
ncbi:MAG: glycine dehydrogenase, partial [Pseudomonadota bacterium]